MNELNRLRDEWVIGKDGSVWVVYRVNSDDEIYDLGRGETVAEALDAAEAYVAEDERRGAERRADYERRRAAGELTPIEIAGAYVPRIWREEILNAAMDTSSLFARMHQTGDTVAIQGFREIAVSTERGNGADPET